MSEPVEFPWYWAVKGDALEQGDLLLGCPRVAIPPEAAGAGGVTLTRDTVDAITDDSRPVQVH